MLVLLWARSEPRRDGVAAAVVVVVVVVVDSSNCRDLSKPIRAETNERRV